LRLYASDVLMGCRAVLFDMDGVLVDSMDVIEFQLRVWAERQGLDAQRVVDMSPGRTNADLVAMFAPHLDALAEARMMLMEEIASAAHVNACDGALELVRQLPPDAWAVVTSGNRVVAHARLRAAGLPVPAVLVTADEVVVGKPDPQGYLLAAAELGVPPHECLVVEDSTAGLEAAARAGMPALAITTDPAQLRAPCEHWVMSLASVRRVTA
jgi:mannitol-1-/sugar-/sorbitol-6-phosphatase